MTGGVQTARSRLLTVVRAGDWERVPLEVDAYGAAVRADERRRTVGEAEEALTRLFDEGESNRSTLAEVRALVLAALERLR